MSGLAVPATNPAPAAPKLDKEPRISRRMRQVLTDLATKGMTQRAAAERAGMNESHVSRELRKPQIQAFIARKSHENIQRGMLRASARLVELVDAESEHVAAKVSERILTSEGILKSDTSHPVVNVGVSVGYVIDLSGQTAGAKVIDGTG
jgi:IS30 family transposase